jgi:hypothetical protein
MHCIAFPAVSRIKECTIHHHKNVIKQKLAVLFQNINFSTYLLWSHDDKSKQQVILLRYNRDTVIGYYKTKII